jgi:histidyl-tRNA synthetase
MSALIEARTLKGFRDYPPNLMIPRERLLETARRVYRSYGFAPIDTPAIEYTEILLGKGGEESDRLIYRFRDHGDRDVALRFDLTVPFARFAAQYVGPNSGQLPVPFKRYAMGPVWRGENTAHGRYREFWQCDFDTIGTTSNASDIEVALVIHDLFAALGFDRFEIRFNNRLILNGLLSIMGLSSMAVPLLRSLDKLLKIGPQKVIEEMIRETGISSENATRIVDLANIKGSNEEILASVESAYGSNPQAAQGIANLRELLSVVKATGLNEARFKVDLSICRGLDYYTGTIYETFLLDKPEIGSVCSGGRYDNLAALYTKQQLPGVGASLGVDRLLAAMEELKLLGTTSTPAPVIIFNFSKELMPSYQLMARRIRAAGIGVEVYPETKKLNAQFQYAEKKGFAAGIIAGTDEMTQGVWKVKDLKARTEIVTSESQILDTIRNITG